MGHREALLEKTLAPEKRVFGDNDIIHWLDSQAYHLLTTFISRLCDSMRGHTLSEAAQSSQPSPVLIGIVSILDKLDEWAEDTPLRLDAQRFGNLAFRDWGRRVEENAEDLHKDVIPDSRIAILPELLHHFKTCFGSFTRIDYGSGHELSFFTYLSLLSLDNPYDSSDFEDWDRQIVSIVYVKYLDLCLHLQKKFRLEPAGSKGVWGLDDYKFLSYLIGSSQLASNSSKLLSPMPAVSDIAKPISLTAPLAVENLLFKSVAQIRVLKSGPFFEHSPVLYNIATTVPNWTKVNSGLWKMYAKEVLEKWPVVQHFYFGRFLSWTSHSTLAELPINPLAFGKQDCKEEEEDLEVTKAPWAAPKAKGGTEVHVPWLDPGWKVTGSTVPNQLGNKKVITDLRLR